MTKKRVLIFILLLAIFGVSFYILMFDMLGEKKPPHIYRISLIVRGSNSDNWAAVRQGALQAASEKNVDLSFVMLGEQNNAQEQASLLRREIASGADAIIIAPANSDKLSTVLLETAPTIPILTIESYLDSPAVVSHIATEHFQMGQTLASYLISRNTSNVKVAVISDGMHSTALQDRYDGLSRSLADAGLEVVLWEIPSSHRDAVTTLVDRLALKEVDALVALDTSTLLMAAQAVNEAKSSYLELFGIGSNANVVSFLEQDVIAATIVQNDFAIGYLSVQNAVDAINNHLVTSSISVEYRLINWKNMYDIENQRLIFPDIR